MEVIMSQQQILPQNTRFMAVLLGFIGGALDVFCHMHYDVLVATQTGNIILMTLKICEGKFLESVNYIIPITSFAIGVAISEIIKRRKEKIDILLFFLPLFRRPFC